MFFTMHLRVATNFQHTIAHENSVKNSVNLKHSFYLKKFNFYPKLSTISYPTHILIFSNKKCLLLYLFWNDKTRI